MARWIFIVIISLTWLNAFSQELKGRIVDEKSNPIPYVNIGVLGGDMGTVTNVQGEFRVNFDGIKREDTIRVSCIGYEYVDLTFSDIKRLAQNDTEIRLTSKVYQIPEVYVQSAKYKLLNLGHSVKATENRVRSDSRLGSELGLIMKASKRKGSCYLRRFSFGLADHDFETTVRINIYDLKDGLPHNNILNKAIFVDIPSDKSEITVKLEAYDIQVDNDFFISIEHFKKTPTSDKRLKFRGVYNPLKMNRSDCFMRKTSHGNWINMKGIEVQFEVEAVVYK